MATERVTCLGGAELQRVRELRDAPPAGAQPWYCRSADSAFEELLERVAASDLPVLVLGETGAGKSICASRLHLLSPRADNSIQALHCGAFSPTALQPEPYYGGWRAAFEAAAGGTILLEDVGDLDLRAQAQLSQLLQDREDTPPGHARPVQPDVRVIATARHSLERAASEGRFLEELYYRLAVVTIHIPALRERPHDIPTLAEFLLRRHAPGSALPLTAAFRRALRQHDWPGNVRELDNLIRRWILFGDPDQLAHELALTRITREGTAGQPPDVPAAHAPVLERVNAVARQVEAETILAALNAARWNRRKAAAELQMDYKALLYRMKKLRLERCAPAVLPSNGPKLPGSFTPFGNR